MIYVCIYKLWTSESFCGAPLHIPYTLRKCAFCSSMRLFDWACGLHRFEQDWSLFHFAFKYLWAAVLRWPCMQPRPPSLCAMGLGGEDARMYIFIDFLWFSLLSIGFEGLAGGGLQMANWCRESYFHGFSMLFMNFPRISMPFGLVGARRLGQPVAACGDGMLPL